MKYFLRLLFIICLPFILTALAIGHAGKNLADAFTYWRMDMKMELATAKKIWKNP